MNKKMEIRIRVGGIICRNGQMLLISHKKDGHIYWLLPGGGVEFGESLEEALKREFMEELNINVSVGELAFALDSIAPDRERHIVNICFNCVILSGDPMLGREERLNGFAFFNAEELGSLKIYPPIGQMLVSILRSETGALEKSKIYLGKMWSSE